MRSGIARAWRHLGTEHWARTLCLISLFVGSWRCGSDVLEAPVTAFRFQWVKPAILRSMASQGRRVLRKAPCLIRAREGQILFASSAALQQRAALCQGRRVWVLKVKRYVDAGAVAASIDTHAWFAMGGGAGTSVAWHAAVTWHAARLHHRCRLFVLPTAPCESIGSFMRLHWDPRGSEITPQAFSDRIFLAQAGVRCLGSAEDEALVSAVAAEWQSSSKRLLRPFPQRGSSPSIVARNVSDDTRAGVIAQARALTLQGVTSSKERKEYLAAKRGGSAPCDLPEELAQRLGPKPSSGRIPVLPDDVRGLHLAQRGVASTTQKEHRREWANSLPGRQWEEEKKRLLRADEGSSQSGSGAERKPIKKRR